MAAISRHFHPQTNMEWMPLSKAAPEINAQGNGAEELMALVMLDHDGESHVYPFSDEGRQRLIELVTGGITVPPRIVLPKH